MNDLNVKLSTPFEYDSKGEVVDATFVSITSPTAKHIHLTATLKQAFQVAAMKIHDSKGDDEKEEKEDKDDSKISPSDAMALIYAGGDAIDIKVVMASGRELLTSGLVLVEGEEKLTKPLCDKLSQDDFEEIIGTFLVNFIVASLLKKTN